MASTLEHPVLQQSGEDVTSSPDCWNFDPDWRWDLAIEENDCLKRGEGIGLSNDFYVVLARRIQSMMGTTAGRRWVRLKWREIYDIYVMGTDSCHNTLRSILEIKIMQRLTEEEAMTELAWLRKGQYNLYKKWFFDIDPMRDSYVWMDQKVIRSKAVQGKRHLDLAARVLAANELYDDAEAEILMGRSSRSKLLAELKENERSKQLLHYITGDLRLLDEQRAILMESAYKTADERRYRESGDDRKTASLLPDGYVEGLESMAAKLTQGEESHMLADLTSGVDPMYGMTDIRSRLLEQHKKDNETTAAADESK